MEIETARMVLFGIAGVGALVWLASLRFLQAAARSRQAETSGGGAFSASETSGMGNSWGRPPEDAWEDPGRSSRSKLSGIVEVEGEPADLSARAASMLATGSLGFINILERSDRHIVFGCGGRSGVGGAGGVGRQRSWMLGSFQAELRFEDAGMNRSRVEYRAEIPRGRWLLVTGAVFQMLGLITLAGGFWVLYTYVLPHENPAVRVQVIQMAQAVHFLWPPFLFGALYRRWGSSVKSALETMIRNLQHVRA